MLHELLWMLWIDEKSMSKVIYLYRLASPSTDAQMEMQWSAYPEFLSSIGDEGIIYCAWYSSVFDCNLSCEDKLKLVSWEGISILTLL